LYLLFKNSVLYRPPFFARQQNRRDYCADKDYTVATTFPFDEIDTYILAIAQTGTDR